MNFSKGTKKLKIALYTALGLTGTLLSACSGTDLGGGAPVQQVAATPTTGQQSLPASIGQTSPAGPLFAGVFLTDLLRFPDENALFYSVAQGEPDCLGKVDLQYLLKVLGKDMCYQNRYGERALMPAYLQTAAFYKYYAMLAQLYPETYGSFWNLLINTKGQIHHFTDGSIALCSGHVSGTGVYHPEGYGGSQLLGQYCRDECAQKGIPFGVLDTATGLDCRAERFAAEFEAARASQNAPDIASLIMQKSAPTVVELQLGTDLAALINSKSPGYNFSYNPDWNIVTGMGTDGKWYFVSSDGLINPVTNFVVGLGNEAIFASYNYNGGLDLTNTTPENPLIYHVPSPDIVNQWKSGAIFQIGSQAFYVTQEDVVTFSPMYKAMENAGIDTGLITTAVSNVQWPIPPPNYANAADIMLLNYMRFISVFYLAGNSLVAAPLEEAVPMFMPAGSLVPAFAFP